MSSALKLLLAAASALAVAACSSITPIAVTTTPKRPPGPLPRAQAAALAKTVERYEGTAWTTLYTGQLRAGPCRGSYTGNVENEQLALELHCDDGRYGMGRAVRYGAQLAGGTVQFNDGTVATVRATGPQPEYRLLPDPAPWDFSWPSRQAQAGRPPS